MEQKYGLQLYSVRDAMEADFENALKQVAEMGYTSVEFAVPAWKAPFRSKV